MVDALRIIENSFSIHDNFITIYCDKVHEDAKMTLNFQRTLRIPDDGKTYPLPPGLNNFPIRHTDDFKNLPSLFQEHRGVMFPMYQAEAMWISFDRGFGANYPFAVKILSGGINAANGDISENEIDTILIGPNEGDQNYLPIPSQPWLDGFCYEKGKIKQFFAMPLGQGFTVEEQLTGKATFGGLQIIAYPLKAEIWKKEQEEASKRRSRGCGDVLYSQSYGLECVASAACGGDDDYAMGFGGGGSMIQDLHQDRRPISDYDLDNGVIVYVHVLNSKAWKKITGEEKLKPIVTANAYAKAGLPWFEHYREVESLNGSENLAGTKSVEQLLNENGQTLADESPEIVHVMSV